MNGSRARNWLLLQVAGIGFGIWAGVRLFEIVTT